MTNKLLFLPNPRQLTFHDGIVSLTAEQAIALDSADTQSLYFTARQLQTALKTHANLDWEIIAGTTIPADQIGVTLSIIPDSMTHPQGYQLSITANGIFIIASTPAGAYYGMLTLSQIIEQHQTTLPLLLINDWPDYFNRGVMLDISRDKVPTMETLFDLIDQFAAWKMNQLQLYTEHTFAYRNHPEVWANASPMTGEELLQLDAYCQERFIELVPNQNTFGHMRRWLTHDRYNSLAECPNGCDTGSEEWGYFEEPFTLDPTNPASLDLVRSLIDELGPHFKNRQFNIGADEPVELGQGNSKEVVAKKGKGRVYLEFLQKIYRELKARGYTMQFWGDIIMEYPELTPELPKNSVALEWGYEANHPFDDHGEKFAAAGIPYYVCPGTSSWNSISARTNNAVANLQNAAKNGLKHGAVGYLNTDWGDNGHWQPLPVSYLGFAYGAALSWGYETNLNQDIPQLISHHVFRDETGIMGKLAYDLGNADQSLGLKIHNNSPLFLLLQKPVDEIIEKYNLTEAKLNDILSYIDTVMVSLEDATINRPDAALIKQEFNWVANMLRHACRRGVWSIGNRVDDTLRQQLATDAEQLLDTFRQTWQARNRSGGLDDSFAWLVKMANAYDTDTDKR
ncbi:glycoside hydrolase family 20 zincin-like fold domain-containing protein [Anaerolineales bacterium HSG24]|nr:glycoside hydrolase family 20 zincin-like fold domain-containing protein [Anaerolineales bacterium HSG24]